MNNNIRIGLNRENVSSFSKVKIILKTSLDHAVEKVTKSSFILLAGCVFNAIACAYLHDLNVVLICGLVGIVFHKNIPEMTDPILSLMEAPFKLLNILTTPSGEKIKGRKWRVLLTVCNLTMRISFSASMMLFYLYTAPISVLATEIFCAASCGAALASPSLKIVELCQY